MNSIQSLEAGFKWDAKRLSWASKTAPAHKRVFVIPPRKRGGSWFVQQGYNGKKVEITSETARIDAFKSAIDRVQTNRRYRWH